MIDEIELWKGRTFDALEDLTTAIRAATVMSEVIQRAVSGERIDLGDADVREAAFLYLTLRDRMTAGLDRANVLAAEMKRGTDA
jgi:hypothetical protein